MITREEEEILGKFVADMPTKLAWQSPTSTFHSWVFWSPEEEEEANHLTSSSSSSTSSILAIRNHIKTALFSSNFFCFHDELVQFWAPTTTTTGGLHLLTTSHQPFALKYMNEHLARYRKHCVSYKFAVGDGIPGRVFRNQVNEYSPDVSYYSINDYPLRDLALSCGITQIMALPIFQDHSCVGVLELLFYPAADLLFDNYLYSVFLALEITGLEIIHTQRLRRKQIQEGTDHVWEKINKALRQACETYDLPLARAWVRCIHSTSMGHCNNLSCRGELVVSMPTYDHSRMSCSSVEYYLDAVHFQAMRVGRGLLGNAFLWHKPYLCRDVTQLSMREYPMSHTTRNLGLTSCFGIGLQSIATGNRDYVLEFFFHKGTTYSKSDFHGLLSSLVKMLKRHLESFEAVTGDPGDELFIEFDKLSINSVFESLKTCPTIVTHIESGALQKEGEFLEADFSSSQLVMKELVKKGNDFVGLEQSQVACRSKEKRPVKKSKAQNQMKDSSCSYETLKQHFGRKLEDAAESLGVSRSTLKRWCRDNNIRRWPFPKRSKIGSSQPIPKQITAPIPENVVPILESSVRDPSSSDLPGSLAPTQATSKITVKATYRNDIIKFQLYFSSRMTDLMEKVILRLKLSEGTFSIKYQDADGDYILIACDEDLEDCIKSLKLLKQATIEIMIEPITYIAP